MKIDNLSRTLLAGVVSRTLAAMLADREVERERLQPELGAEPPAEVRILPHPALLRRFEQKVAGIREALNDPAVRTEAAETIRSLIARVTIEMEDGQVSAEVEASALTLIDFAQNAENLRHFRGRGSVTVVAGTGFNRCRTRVSLFARRHHHPGLR
jgi:hypothetical protein